MIHVGIVIGDITKKAGTERAVTNLSNMLCESGKYHVWIISMYSSENDKPGYEIFNGVDVIHLHLKQSNRFFAYAKFVHMSGKIAVKYGLQIMIGTTHAINCLLSFFRKKVSIVACEHVSYGACPKDSRRIRQKIYPKLDAIVLLTKADASNYTFINSEKKYVIPNSLSFDNEIPANLKSRRILAIGRLTAQKWFQKLLEASTEIKNKLPDWHIDIFGEGEEREELQEMIKEKGLIEYVHIYPPVENVKELFMDSDIFVVTSRREGLPMVILEAQACGLPVVSFDCNYGPRELIEHDRNGYLIPVGDAHSLAEKVIEIAVDDEKKRRMGRASFQNSKKYKTSEIFLLWDGMLHEVANIKE